MFKKILIANRGEIAVKIIKTCKEMGIHTVAVCSDIDRNSLHAQIADEVVCIGPGPVKDSYLNMQSIFSVALLKGVDAIHPGYGFLAENSKFAEICESNHVKFIGPSSKSIRLIGDKLNAHNLAKKQGIRVLEGSEYIINNLFEALKAANLIGYPVILKASSGGGGKGIRIVNDDAMLEEAYYCAEAEMNSSFGDGCIYIEKYINNAKYIEFQVMADKYGNVVHLGERECSIQRKKQKLLEESPSTAIDEELRNEMGNAAVKIIKAAKYCGIGTVEFLLDKDKQYYFLEVNTRIQVEYSVTEMVTSIDIIKEQINIAYGNKLSIMQKDVKSCGNAIECRINAEDTNNNFFPSSGKIHRLELPYGSGLRVDTALYEGCVIPQYYDSMIAKIIVHGKNRNEAIDKMKAALRKLKIDGIKSNINYHLEILNNKEFIQGSYTTQFLDTALVKKNESDGVRIKKKHSLNSCGYKRYKVIRNSRKMKAAWIRCKNCNEIMDADMVYNNMKVCLKCDYHYRLSAKERIHYTLDEGSLMEYDKELETINLLELDGYAEKIKSARIKTGVSEAVISGEGLINNIRIVICVMDPHFMMGSMGTVVGEKITRSIEKAIKKHLPVVIFTASGGARMQEGIFSLLQMAKINASLAKLALNKIPYITVITDPTTGGVTASFGMVGDIIISEPKALVGFAGRRVIKDTINEELPSNFQSAEFLLEHGFIDMIVHRRNLKEMLTRILTFHKQD